MSPSLSRSVERVLSLLHGGLCCPPFLPQLGVVPWLGLPQFLLSTSCLFQWFIHHTFKSPCKYYTSLNTATHVKCHGCSTQYTYTHNLQFLFLFSFMAFRSAGPELSCREQKEPTYLEDRRLAHGGELPSTLVPCLKPTALALTFQTPLTPPTPLSPYYYNNDINNFGLFYLEQEVIKDILV
jgi:hypothetical protein